MEGRGPVALVGSGEYLPEMAPIEGALLEGRPARYVQLATASVPDGPAVVERWHQMGRAQAARLGAEAVVLPVATRDDADDPTIAAQVAGAGLVYLSGGKPQYLADVLRGSAVWAAIVAAWEAGAALAGCSAGAMVMAARIPSLRHPRQGGGDGLGLLGHLRVIPHFDAFAGRLPGAADRFLLPDDPAVTLVGVDERTAIVGGPEHWEVHGAGSAWILGADGRRQHRAGTTLRTPIPG